MKRSVGEKAWAVLGLGVVAYEIWAPENELLSEVVDRFLMKHPVLTRVIVLGIALHLINLIPPKYDPLHQTAVIVRSRRNRDTLLLLKLADPHDEGLDLHGKPPQENKPPRTARGSSSSYRIVRSTRDDRRSSRGQRLVRSRAVRVLGQLGDQHR